MHRNQIKPGMSALVLSCCPEHRYKFGEIEYLTLPYLKLKLPDESILVNVYDIILFIDRRWEPVENEERVSS